MDNGHCFGCKNPIGRSRFAKTADNLYFHETCFNCQACGDSLINALYYSGPDFSGYYCKDDYLLRWGIECQLCHIFIEGKPLRDTKGNYYHDACLQCCECQISLANDCYKFEGNFYCKRHYYEKCGKKCQGCHLFIYHHQEDLVTLDDGVYFHSTCFACHWCQKLFDPLLAKYFGAFMATDMLCRSCQSLKNESLNGHHHHDPPPPPPSTPSKEDEATKIQDGVVMDQQREQEMKSFSDNNFETKNGNECTLCFDRHVDSVFIPCGHMCLCHGCATTYLQSKVDEAQKICPICRTACTGVFRTYPSS